MKMKELISDVHEIVEELGNEAMAVQMKLEKLTERITVLQHALEELNDPDAPEYDTFCERFEDYQKSIEG